MFSTMALVDVGGITFICHFQSSLFYLLFFHFVSSALTCILLLTPSRPLDQLLHIFSSTHLGTSQWIRTPWRRSSLPKKTRLRQTHISRRLWCRLPLSRTFGLTSKFSPRSHLRGWLVHPSTMKTIRLCMLPPRIRTLATT